VFTGILLSTCAGSVAGTHLQSKPPPPAAAAAAAAAEVESEDVKRWSEAAESTAVSDTSHGGRVVKVCMFHLLT